MERHPAKIHLCFDLVEKWQVSWEYLANFIEIVRPRCSAIREIDHDRGGYLLCRVLRGRCYVENIHVLLKLWREQARGSFNGTSRMVPFQNQISRRGCCLRKFLKVN